MVCAFEFASIDDLVHFLHLTVIRRRHDSVNLVNHLILLVSVPGVSFQFISDHNAVCKHCGVQKQVFDDFVFEFFLFVDVLQKPIEAVVLPLLFFVVEFWVSHESRDLQQEQDPNVAATRAFLTLLHNDVDVSGGADLFHHPRGPVVGHEGFTCEVHTHDGEAFSIQRHLVCRAFVSEYVCSLAEFHVSIQRMVLPKGVPN